MLKPPYHNARGNPFMPSEILDPPGTKVGIQDKPLPLSFSNEHIFSKGIRLLLNIFAFPNSVA